MFTDEQFAVIILAAGKSSRMGTTKALLNFDEKFTFVEKIIEQFVNAGAQKCVVVCNSNDFNQIKYLEKKNIILVENDIQESSRFYSIYLGCKNLKEYEYVFIHNVDNPYIKTSDIQKIYLNKNPNEYIVPVYNNQGGHPILINKKILEQILIQNTYNQILRNFLKHFNRKNVIFMEENILYNINTFEQYKKLKNNKL